ncbi:MAG: ribonuclease Z [Acidobacteriota bacterium]
MYLTVLGSGSSVPDPKRSSSGYWLETSGGNILLDCSPTALHRILAEGLDWPGLDAIWISHFHLDHFGGVAPLLASFKHAVELAGRIKPLRLFGGAGLRDLIEDLDSAGGYHLLEQDFRIEITEVTALEPFDIVDGVQAVALKTLHTDESHAIHIRDGETTLVFTADTGFDPAIAAFAKGVDVLLIECTFVRNKPLEKHLELAEAMYLTRKAMPKRAVLTHFDPEWNGVSFNEEVAIFDPPCHVIAAADGMVLSIP